MILWLAEKFKQIRCKHQLEREDFKCEIWEDVRSNVIRIERHCSLICMKCGYHKSFRLYK